MNRVIDPFLIVGILISLLFALILYITGVETVQSTIFALLGIIISLHIDQISRSEKNTTKLMEHTQLIKKMEKHPWMSTVITEIVDSAEMVLRDTDNKLFKEEVKLKLERCRDALQEASRGQLKAPLEHVDHFISATNAVQHQLRATSVSNVDIDRRWWESPVGLRYWEAQKRALTKGVEIERIFIYEEWNSSIESVVHLQAREGVKVHTISRDQIPVHLRIDMIIFDDAFTYEVRLSSDGLPLENIFSINTSDTNHKIKVFDQLRLMANEFMPENDT
jgi:hypothetical protein